MDLKESQMFINIVMSLPAKSCFAYCILLCSPKCQTLSPPKGVIYMTSPQPFDYVALRSPNVFFIPFKFKWYTVVAIASLGCSTSFSPLTHDMYKCSHILRGICIVLKSSIDISDVLRTISYHSRKKTLITTFLAVH